MKKFVNRTTNILEQTVAPVIAAGHKYAYQGHSSPSPMPGQPMYGQPGTQSGYGQPAPPQAGYGPQATPREFLFSLSFLSYKMSF